MTQQLADLLTAALALAPAEREQLADSLWASLDPPDAFAGMTEDELVAELDRRAAELKADPGQCVPWDEVRNMR